MLRRAFTQSSIAQAPWDREAVLKAVKSYGILLWYADEALRADRAVVLEAVKNDGKALVHASDDLRGDREVVLEAVKQNGNALEHASVALRADREIVLEAVKQFRWALRHASPAVQTDKAFLIEAMQKSNLSLDCLRVELRANKDVVLEAVKHHGDDLVWASEAMRDDFDVVFEATKQDGRAVFYASNRLVEANEDLVLLAARRGAQEALDEDDDFADSLLQDIIFEDRFQVARKSLIAVAGEDAPIVTVRVHFEEASNQFDCEASLLSGANFVCHVEGRSFLELWAHRRRLGRTVSELAKRLVEELPKHTQAKSSQRVFISIVLNEDGDSVAITPWDSAKALSDFIHSSSFLHSSSSSFVHSSSASSSSSTSTSCLAAGPVAAGRAEEHGRDQRPAKMQKTAATTE